MYLKKLEIQGYKGFRDAFSISFQKGLNVIVGENASGKTGVIDAIRLLLREDEFGHTAISESDFHRPFDSPDKWAETIRLMASFADLSDEEHVAFLPWSDMDGNASLTLEVKNKQNRRGRYKRDIWGGASRASIFEWELFDCINCVYLPPLRDAEARLTEGKSSRLARLLKNLERKAIEQGMPHPIVSKVSKFNKELSEQDGAIARANQLIRARLRDATGELFSQDTLIQFSEATFNRIVEGLRLVFFPDSKGEHPSVAFRALEENSLGYNNLLYVATVLAELNEIRDDYLRILLIEEPEAHLHPQLQIRLLKYFERTCRESNVQIIITTHSPVLASSASLDSVIHLSSVGDKNPAAIPLRKCDLKDHSKLFLERWLDVTKSNLLFARGVILVEGISEAMVLPELAKRVLDKYNKQSENKDSKLPRDLENAGVSVINMNGIYFDHFMQLFANLNEEKSECIPVRCAGIFDNDPPKEDWPIWSKPVKGTNRAFKLMDEANISQFARLYPSPLKTFEYDLAMKGGNLNMMIPVAQMLLERDGSIWNSYEDFKRKNWGEEPESSKSRPSRYLLEHIDKGAFAQRLADELKRNDLDFAVPDYIRRAVIWACGGDPEMKEEDRDGS